MILTIQGLTRQLQRKRTKYLGKFSLYCNSKNKTKKLRVGVFTSTKGNANKANRHKLRAPSYQRPTDQPTDRPTNRAAYRVACT